jgi:DtxR family transcriptional regulator, Mn-dependent transcriptional regulator
MLSQSIEDYLKHIYELQTEKTVNTSMLAERLDVSPASVSEMVSKLSKLGWITNTPYHGFRLTREGEKIAVNLIRKHRLIEVFLQKHLKYSWDEVHSEAERFEHACSDKFIDKLEEYLGYPKIDPHGDPIPAKNGSVPGTHDLPLSKADEGKSYVISKVNDTSNEILKFISKLGLKLRSRINIKEKLDFDKSVVVRVNHKEYLLSNKIAENISVIEVTN